LTKRPITPRQHEVYRVILSLVLSDITPTRQLIADRLGQLANRAVSEADLRLPAKRRMDWRRLANRSTVLAGSFAIWTQAARVRRKTA
jgi:hypothetical protein